MKITKISDAEMEVMQYFWQGNHTYTPTQLLEVLEQNKSWKYSTIKTFLTRLVEKGLLSCKKGRVNSYKAIVTEEEYKRYETKVFLDTLHKGSMKSMLASLCNGDITDERLEELLKELEE